MPLSLSSHETQPPSIPSPEIDEQDPLPESNWLWRRLCLIGSLVVLLIHRSWESYQGAHYAWTDWLIITILILYTVAPSAEQVSKMIATVSLLAPGNVALRKMQTASSTPAAKTTTATSEVTPVQAPSLADDPDAGVLPPELRVKR